MNILFHVLIYSDNIILAILQNCLHKLGNKRNGKTAELTAQKHTLSCAVSSRTLFRTHEQRAAQKEHVCSHIVSFVKASGYRPCSRVKHPAGWTVPILLPWGAAAAENPPSNQQKGARCPSQVKRRTYLPLLCLYDYGVVEGSDDTVSRPAHRDHEHDRSTDEGDSSGDHNSGFGPLLL